MTGCEQKKVIFVCTGNTCRSPMAEAIFRSEMKRRGLTVQVSSAGTEAAVGVGMNFYSLRTLATHGLSIENFAATQLTEELAGSAYALICMTNEQKDRIYRHFARTFGEESPYCKKVYAFSDFCGYSIPDPFGYSIEVYESTFQALEGGMSAVIDGLFPVKASQILEKPTSKTSTKKKNSPQKKPVSKSKNTSVVKEKSEQTAVKKKTSGKKPAQK